MKKIIEMFGMKKRFRVEELRREGDKVVATVDHRVANYWIKPGILYASLTEDVVLGNIQEFDHLLNCQDPNNNQEVIKAVCANQWFHRTLDGLYDDLLFDAGENKSFKGLRAKKLNFEQQNSFYDESRNCNGGGYDQPAFDFVILDQYDNIVASGRIEDTSCGDFGGREDVTFTPKGGKTLSSYWDNVSRQFYSESDFDKKNPEHCHYRDIIGHLLGYWVEFAKDPWDCDDYDYGEDDE